MPSTPTTGSTNIAILDSQIIADLCSGTFFIDISPSVFIADGNLNVLGANVEIVNPYGIVVKPYGTNYEIAPDLSGAMDGVISFPIPTQAGNYQYGKYTVNVQLYDADGTSWIVSKPVTICVPDKNNKTRNYGSLSAQLKGNCVDGKLFVIIDNVPTYNGTIVESQVLTGTLEYPTSSELPPLTITTGTFAVVLFEGVYKLTGEICATYNFGDNVYVRVKYKIKKEKNIRCLIDQCCVLAALAELQARTGTDCTDEEKQLTGNTILEALNLLRMAELAGECGEDPSDYVEELEKLLGCKCTCNCAEGTPIINNTPSSDVIIEGCNTSVVTNGLTKTYTINNYAYEVTINDNGGALVATAGTLADCTITQEITFDISVVYNQIKNLANQNNTEGDFWASVINKALRDINPSCLGLTDEAWQALSFSGKMSAVFTKMCACCGTCDSTITDVDVNQVGGDVVLTWEGDAYLFDVYLDGVLKTTILTSGWPTDEFSYTFAGAADGTQHTWIIVSKCSNGSIGQTETGTFEFAGCPDIAKTILVTLTGDAFGNYYATGPCPFDLTALVDVSNPLTSEWHTANNTNADTLITNPATVLGGIYYVFNKDADGCYSPGTRVRITCDAEESCTAPQNLTVGPFGVNNFYVQFQSAAYPPPLNSYTVKRRLASAPDVGGSYTTIGTPVWNATLNRWVIADLTAVDNTLYVYRAVSNCGSTEPSIDYEYLNLVCPALVLYPTFTTVAYSFVPITTAVEIFVTIFDVTGTIDIHTDTYNPAYSNPTEGLFEYLTPGTTYKVRLSFVFGGTEKVYTCTMQTVETDAA